MVFYWDLSDCKSPGLFFCILADLNNAVVWMISTRALISKSSSPCTNPLFIVSSAPITIGIIVAFMFHSFFKLSCKVLVLSSFLFSFSFTLWSARTANFTIRFALFFSFLVLSFLVFFVLLTIIWSVRVTWYATDRGKGRSIPLLLCVWINSH